MRIENRRMGTEWCSRHAGSDCFPAAVRLERSATAFERIWTMSIEENKATVWRAYDSAMHKKDFETSRACFAPEFLLHSPLFGAPLNLDGYIDQIRSTTSKFPDLEVVFETVVAEADLVAVRHVFYWTHVAEYLGVPPTGERVTVRGTDVYRFVDGRIVEEWGLADTYGLLQQLGAVPPLGSQKSASS
jgi:steroid delta-isomerase-like uncharacterized protein